jgi:hypothetical protein
MCVRVWVYVPIYVFMYVSVCLPISILYHLTDFHETSYEHCSIGGQSNALSLISYNQ